MHTFSKTLIQKTIQYFRDNYNYEISEDSADMYILTMAGYFEAFVRIARIHTPFFDKLINRKIKGEKLDLYSSKLKDLITFRYNCLKYFV